MVRKTTNIGSIKITVVACLPDFISTHFLDCLKAGTMANGEGTKLTSYSKCLMEPEKEDSVAQDCRRSGSIRIRQLLAFATCPEADSVRMRAS